MGEKISLDIDQRQRVVDCIRQPKKSNEQFELPHSRRQVRIWELPWCSRAEEKICSASRKCVAHANKNFWSVSLTDRPCGILRYPSHIFFSLSLIVKERGHHELSIVLTANFLAATGDFPCRGKTHCALNATHRIRCHT